jgi:chitinase
VKAGPTGGSFIADGVPHGGGASDSPVQGDFNGDVVSDFGIYRASEGKWYVKAGPTGGSFIANGVPHGGGASDVPLVGSVTHVLPPAASIGNVTKVEGPPGQTTKFKFTVLLSRVSLVPVTVAFATANGTAKKPGDYKTKRGTVTIPPGSTAVKVTVPVVGDNLVEPDEVFYVNLSNPVGATISDAQGVGTITNDD